MPRITTFRDADGKRPIDSSVVFGGDSDLYQAAKRALQRAKSQNEPTFFQFDTSEGRSKVFDMAEVSSLIYLKLKLV